jgi:hypothetical protein
LSRPGFQLRDVHHALQLPLFLLPEKDPLLDERGTLLQHLEAHEMLSREVAQRHQCLVEKLRSQRHQNGGEGYRSEDALEGDPRRLQGHEFARCGEPPEGKQRGQEGRKRNDHHHHRGKPVQKQPYHHPQREPRSMMRSAISKRHAPGDKRTVKMRMPKTKALCISETT